MGTSPSPDVPVRYTPITGRVSRAKKGVPVHICEACNPPKVRSIYVLPKKAQLQDECADMGHRLSQELSILG